MLKNRTLTAIIPVRGGSKRIPRKNLRKLGGNSLLERAIKLALSCSRIERTLVTTDDPEMHACAQGYGVAAPSLRPADLAGDTVSTVDVVRHLIDDAAIPAGYLLLLQASSPLRTRGDLNALLDTFEPVPDAEAIVSLCRHEEPHPEKLQKIVGKWVTSYLGTDSHRPVQSLPEVFALNGAFYLVDRDVFLRERSFLPRHTLQYVMPPERSVNLDTMADWAMLEAMVAQGHWTYEEYD